MKIISMVLIPIPSPNHHIIQLSYLLLKLAIFHFYDIIQPWTSFHLSDGKLSVFFAINITYELLVFKILSPVWIPHIGCRPMCDYMCMNV